MTKCADWALTWEGDRERPRVCLHGLAARSTSASSLLQDVALKNGLEKTGLMDLLLLLPCSNAGMEAKELRPVANAEWVVDGALSVSTR